MSLQDLIDALREADPDAVLRRGFRHPHSYRGHYERLAFEPAGNVPVREMLRDAESALGQTFEGYKGGDFKMGPYTSVYLAEYGCCGEELGPLLLSHMLADVTR